MTLPITVCRVETPEGTRDFVTFLPHERLFSKGLPAKAIMGVLVKPIEPGQPIPPEAFAINTVFWEYVHEVVRKHGPELATVQAAAQEIGDGWVDIVDHRTEAPHDEAPTHDIIGEFRVRDGVIDGESYRPNREYIPLTHRGFLQPGEELAAALLAELSEDEKPLIHPNNDAPQTS
jgi:hypothetical protein